MDNGISPDLNVPRALLSLDSAVENTTSYCHCDSHFQVCLGVCFHLEELFDRVLLGP